MDLKYSLYGRFYNQVIKRWPKIFGDVLVVKIMYYLRFREELNLKNPQTFNEKINWLKLFDHNPLKEVCSDKYAVRDFIKERVGGEYLIPLLGVYESPYEINFDDLPTKFVLKTNHASGTNIIVFDKTQLNLEEINSTLSKWLKINHYYNGREWQYKKIKPLIICENFMGNNENVPKDYKIFCFDGTPVFLWVDKGRFTNHKRIIYSTNWEKLPFCYHFKYEPHEEEDKPEGLNEMLSIATKLSNGFKFVSIDLYYTHGKVYFGEMTFTPTNGLSFFDPLEYDLKIGEYLSLR